jgi:hypothetical protein
MLSATMRRAVCCTPSLQEAEAGGRLGHGAHWAINSVKKGGIVSIVGVYGPTGNVIPIGNVGQQRHHDPGQPGLGQAVAPPTDRARRGRPHQSQAIITHKVPLEEVADAYHILFAKLDGASSPFLCRPRPELLEENGHATTSNRSASVIGWGVDADPENDPTYPMRAAYRDDKGGMNWPRPALQPNSVELLQSTEHNRRTAVFGTSTPPSGLSGAIRRRAFHRSEGKWGHWLMLLMADRVNMVEGLFQDFGRGRIPNIPAEMGMRSELRHNLPGVCHEGGNHRCRANGRNSGLPFP